MNESPRTPSGGEAEKLVRSLAKIRASADLPLDALDEFRAAYLAAPRDVRESFFSLLLVRMEVSREAVETPLRSVLEAPSGDPVEWTSLLTDLRRTLESPRMRVFRRFLNVSGGLKFLLDLRADVLAAERQSELDLAPIDEEISYLFNSWFQYGFLFLQEITQDSSYRQIHFLKGHDMVHPMARLEEMGNRLGEDRHSFALYHRAMPEEPIVFIEAALTRRIPRSIHEILADPLEPGNRSGHCHLLLHQQRPERTGRPGIREAPDLSGGGCHQEEPTADPDLRNAQPGDGFLGTLPATHPSGGGPGLPA